MLRFLDIFFSILGLFLLSPILVVLYIWGLFDTGSPLFSQQRVGRNQKPFLLIKFRTMRLETETLPTHLVNVSVVTPMGSILRTSKLDELPQLWNVLKGEMSLIGPRPCLLNQTEVIFERSSRGLFSFRPGITGLSQINNIDMSTPKLLAETDAEMIYNLTTGNYLKYIFKTILGKGAGDRVK